MATAPALGEVAPGQLLVDPQTLTIWVGVDTSVSPAGSLLVCDMQQLAAADQTILTQSKTYTDGRLSGAVPAGGKAYVQEGHKHTSADITDFNAAVAATVAMSVLPIGAIILWSGRSDDVGKNKGPGPDGSNEGGYDLTAWTVCNGIPKYGQTVPNLVNRFIIGSDDAPGNTAWCERGTGSNDPSAATKVPTYRDMPMSSAGGHAHTGAVGATALSVAQMPAHRHGHNKGSDTGFDSSDVFLGISTIGATPNVYDLTGGTNFTTVTLDYVGNNQAHGHTISSDGVHSHTFGAKPDNVVWFALCYIMKVK